MTTAVQHRRGTTAEHASFTGLEGEVTIDTTKDTAVIHDGTLAGGYPLAKENLANVTTSGLSSIDGASTASDDKFFIYDQSATSLKTITRAELNNAIEQDALANVAITGGTINGTTIGGTTAAAVSATTLTTSSTVTLNGGSASGVAYLNGSKVLTTGSALTFDGSNFEAVNATSAQVAAVRGTQRMVIGADGFTNAYVGTTTAHDVSFLRGGSEQMRLTSTGLGIGTSSPATKFVVSNAGALGVEFDPASGAMQVYNRSTSAYGTMNLWANTLYFRTGASPAINMTLDASGRLGIGTSSPTSPLHVVGAAGYVGTFDGATDTRIDFKNSGTRNGIIQSSSASFNINAVTAIPLIFLTSSAERMRIDSAGNVGIGTSSFGASNLSGFTAEPYVGGIIANIGHNGSASNGDAYLQFRRNGTSLGYIYQYSSTGIGINSADALRFSTAGTERAQIDSSGNLGLGVTPAASAIPQIQISRGVFTGDINSAYVSNNWYYNGGDKFIGSNYALQYKQLGTTGQHQWFTSTASGTAGDAISFTQAMTLDASGNLLVGQTGQGPANAYSFCVGVSNTGGNDISHPSGAASGVMYERFNYGGSTIGSITQNGTTAVAYNTSSDYRLKNITGPITNSGAYIDSLNPVEGTWKADGSTFVGLIAHEAQEVSRTNVATGVKDGEQMQGMDYSSAEIIGNMIAEIQSLRKRLAAAGI